jgi:excisionase family DNA binding protein
MPAETPTTRSRLLTIEKAAEVLGVTPRMVRRLTASRRLPFVKVGRLVRFRDADLAKFIEEGTVPAVRRPRSG